MKKPQNQFTGYDRNGQQVIALNSEVLLPESSSVLLTSAELEELFYQYAKRLAENEDTDHSAVYIDGTKIESKAGRYTFVWKKTILKQRDKVKAELKKLFGMETKTELRKHLKATAEGVDFIHGKVKRKTSQQRKWENLTFYWSGGRDMMSISPPWDTAIPKRIMTPHSCA